MKLNVRNPLAFIDLETTGIDVTNDRIVEIAVVKIYPDGKEEVRCRRVNPTIPIPKEATAVHGITDEDVKDEPTLRRLPSRWHKCWRDAILLVSTQISSISPY